GCVARALRAKSVRPCIPILFEMLQIRTRLPLLCGPDQAVGANEVVLLADANVLVVFLTIVLEPDRVVTLAAIVLDDCPRTRQRMVVARDLIMQNFRVGTVEVEALLEDCLAIGVERYTAGLISVGTLYMAGFDFQRVEATVAILVDPTADRV